MVKNYLQQFQDEKTHRSIQKLKDEDWNKHIEETSKIILNIVDKWDRYRLKPTPHNLKVFQEAERKFNQSRHLKRNLNNASFNTEEE